MRSYTHKHTPGIHTTFFSTLLLQVSCYKSVTVETWSEIHPTTALEHQTLSMFIFLSGTYLCLAVTPLLCLLLCFPVVLTATFSFFLSPPFSPPLHHVIFLSHSLPLVWEKEIDFKSKKDDTRCVILSSLLWWVLAWTTNTHIKQTFLLSLTFASVYFLIPPSLYSNSWYYTFTAGWVC